MPFINVDYKTRDKMVKDYLLRKKLVRDRLLAERTGDIELQQNLTKFFKPLTKSQKEIQEEATKNIGRYQLEAARRITEGLTPIREGVEQLPAQLSQEIIKATPLELPTYFTSAPPSYHTEEGSEISLPAIPKLEKLENYEENKEIYDFVKVFNIELKDYKYDFDDIFRIHFDTNLEKFKFGNKVISYNLDDNTFSFEGIKEKIPASDGLWELILSKNPDEKKYNKNDLNNYQSMVYLSDIIFIGNDPDGDFKNYYIHDKKWKGVVNDVHKFILEEKKKTQSTGKGLRKKKKTTIVIPSDPNALLERFDLLMSSKDAGHTGVKNELVSICDELKRQKVLNTKSYKKLMSIL